MAMNDYSADSARFIPSSPMVLVRSDMTASGRRAFVLEFANDDASSPATTPSIG